MSAKTPKNRVFFRYFLSLNEGNLKFKESPWKQHILCQRQFYQLQIGEKNFHLSHVVFELSDFEEWRDRKKPKDKVIKISKFLTLYFLKTIFLFFFNDFLFLTPNFFLLND